MKISSINTLNFSNYRTNNAVMHNKISSDMLGQKNTTLLGIPKSYISFGSVESMKEDERQKQINMYLYYKDKKDYYKEGSTKYYDEYNKEIARLENARGYYTFWTETWKPGKVSKVEKKQILEEKYNEFTAEREKFNKIMANEDYYKSLINTNDIEIYEEIKKGLNSKENSIDNKIAGYAKLKQDLKKLLIEPIQRETAMNNNEKIPPSILLYGPIGCGKSELAKALAEEAGCRVRTMPSSTQPFQFEYELTNELFEARQYYLKQSKANQDLKDSSDYKNLSNKEKAKKLLEMKSPRTIYIIDEVDKYMNPTGSESAEELADMNKTLLKGILDHCSEKPNGEYSSDAAGMTIIFTTTFPTQVHSEISLRGGKCTRMPVSIPNSDDISDIIKFYLHDQNNRIESLQRKGENIESIDVEQIPFAAYSSITRPDKDKGAIGGAGIEAAVRQAVTNYISNPESYINIQLPMMLASAQYRIPPAKLDEYLKEVDAMGKTYREIDEQEEFTLLKDLKELEMINPAQRKRLEFLAASQSFSKQENEN